MIAFGFDERTVASGAARAGSHAQTVQAHWVEQPCHLGQVQADDIRVKTQQGIVWMTLAMMVRTRLWLAGAVSPYRDTTLIRRLLRRVRRGAARRPLLVCTDGSVAYIRGVATRVRDPARMSGRRRPLIRPWRHVSMAQVVKRSGQRRVVAVERRLIAGTPARVETLRRRSQDEGVIITTYIERLSATFRERLSTLTRRGRALARRWLMLEHSLYPIGTVYNFRTPHASLRLAAPAAIALDGP